MAMNRCLIHVALALGACGLLALLMPGVTALAQSRRQQPHSGHEQGSGHEHGHGHVGSETEPAFPGDGDYVPIFAELPKHVTDFVDELNCHIACFVKAKDWKATWVPEKDKYLHITIDESFFDKSLAVKSHSKHYYENTNDDISKLDGFIKKKACPEFRDMLDRAGRTDNALGFKAMALKHSEITSDSEFLYLKLAFGTDDLTRLNAITNRKSDWHISVGHFKLPKDDPDNIDHLKRLTIAMESLVSDWLKYSVGGSGHLKTVGIVRTRNVDGEFDIYRKFPSGVTPACCK